jgi:excisionase family DNA binding protein
LLQPLLTVRAVAAQLGVSTATVYALCECGDLALVRVSNAIRISPSDLAAFVEQNKDAAVGQGNRMKVRARSKERSR